MPNWFSRLFRIDSGQPKQERSSGYDRLLTLALNGNGLHLSEGVSEDTALSVSSVYAAVDRISSSLASVPFNVYERTNEGRRLARDNDQFYLVHTSPAAAQTSFQYRKILFTHALLWGNGFAVLQRDPGSTRPTEYRIVHPCDVSDVKMVDGLLFYFIKGYREPLPFYDVIHVAAFGQGTGANPYLGKSPIRVHAETIGAAKARAVYGAAIMKNGGFMSGIVKSSGPLTPQQKSDIRDGFNNRHAGAGNAGSTAILEYGLDYQQIAMSPEDVQMIEAMKFSVEDIARIYGIPPHMIGHLERSTNNNIEHQGIEYVQYCLSPWATAFEQAHDQRIFRQAERRAGQFYTKLELNALMRGDVAARREFYRLLLDRGVFDINEVRALEDLNPVPGGELRLVQANMIPLSQIETFYNQKSVGNGNPQV